jgi:RNA polymerase sigma factor (sigma-70 family)
MRAQHHLIAVTPLLAASDIELYRRYADDLTRYATGLVGPDHAADVVNDAALAVFRTATWSTVVNQRAYLYRAVYHRALDVQRANRSRGRREVAAARMHSHAAADVSSSVDAFRSLTALTAQQRAVIWLTYWEDMDPAAVASLLGIGEGTVRKQLARSRAKLRKVLS